MRLILSVLLLSLFAGFAAESNAQALWKKRGSGDDGSWYKREREKVREWAKHDLVLIRINERTVASREGEFEERSRYNANLSIQDYIRLGSGLSLQPGDGEERSLGIESDVQNRKEGSIDKQSSFSDVIMAEVTQVMPDYDREEGTGGLMIRAYKEVRFDGDVERVELTGRIDARHIDKQDDSISAEYIFGMNIQYYGEGDVANASSPGWLGRFLSWAWPF